MSVKICFCYAREDEPLLKKLKAHLRPMHREGLIETWYDRDISPGMEWEKAIKEQLESAEVILLLISSDFMDSDYCYSTEMQQALARHNSGDAKVIPIILRPVYWQGTLGKLQALPKDGVAVTDPQWHSLDEALFNAAEGIRRVINELRTKQLSTEIKKVEQSEQIAHTVPSVISHSPQQSESAPPLPTPPSTPTQHTVESTSPKVGPPARIVSPKIEEQWKNKGDILFSSQQYEQALSAYEQALRIDPTDTHVYIAKGHTLNKLQRFRDALAIYNQALTLEPNNASLYRSKGDTLFRLKRFRDALAVYEQIVQSEPDKQQELKKRIRYIKIVTSAYLPGCLMLFLSFFSCTTAFITVFIINTVYNANISTDNTPIFEMAYLLARIIGLLAVIYFIFIMVKGGIKKF